MEPSQSVSGDLLWAQDQERRRLARELHNNTGQNMAALQMNLSLLSATAETLEPRARRALTDSVTLAQSCVRELRDMANELYPPLLDEAGLAVALRAWAEVCSRRTGVRLELDLPDRMERLPLKAEIALFRIVQAAGAAVVRLAREGNSIILELADVADTRMIAETPEVSARVGLLEARLEVTQEMLRVIVPATTAST